MGWQQNSGHWWGRFETLIQMSAPGSIACIVAIDGVDDLPMITADRGQGHTTDGCAPGGNHCVIETRKHQVRNIAIKTLICWPWETFFPGNNMIVPTSVHVLNEWTI